MAIKILKKTGAYVILVMLSLVFLVPFLWMLSTALKVPSQIYSIPPVWIPNPVTLDNFIKGWGYVNFNRFALNTLTIALLATLGSMVSSSLVAYGFARFESRWNQPLFVVVIATMMLPSQVTLIPTYMMFSKLNLLDTYIPLILPGWLGGGAFNIFLLRQFFRGIPRELDQAAKIDGCNSLQIFYKIILHLIKPALTSIGIMSLVYYWNDFMGPLIYLKSESRYTISIGLQFFNSTYGMNKTNLLMAVSILTIIPLMILFLAAQKYFVQGITVTGLKG